MLMFVKTGDSLLMSFMMFSHVFSRNCHSSTPVKRNLCKMGESEVKEQLQIG
jgi:hypothetical protein